MKIKYFFIIILLFYALSYCRADDKNFLFRPDGSNFLIYGKGASVFIINRNRITELKLDKYLSQLTSAKRINNASDDPAGSAVAEKMESMLKQLMQESVNDEDMRNFHDYIESAVAQDQELLQRIRLLLVRSSGGILAPDDMELIQTEISELLKQVNMNAKFSQFNTIRVIPDLTSVNLGLDRIDAVHKVQDSINMVDDTLAKLTLKRVMQGVKSNILTFRIDGKRFHYMNFQKAQSSITDLDMSEGITELIKNSVLYKTQHGLLIKSR
jgi:flagellin